MNRISVVRAGILHMATVSAFMCSYSTAHAETYTLTIHNTYTGDSKYRITEIYVSPVYDNDWGDNLVDQFDGSTLFPGWKSDIRVRGDGCFFDVKTVLANGEEQVTEHINACDDADVTVYPAD